MSAGALPDAPLPPRAFATGDVLGGNYELRELLGEGGMGRVFEAHDRALNRRVAVKVAHPHIRANVLRNEAQALAAIRHPSMVTVHTIGVHEGADYIVMERIYGVSLQSHMEKQHASGERFTVAEVLDVLLALADGLAAVHRAGISHRDVKPGNVMLAPGNRVVLMDFGLVLPEFEVASQTTVAGSPYYMAPEATINAVEEGAGPLVDLYALGVIAFEMLTGDVPYPAEDWESLRAQHLHAPVPDVGVVRADVPAPFAELVRALLAKEPRARPQSADGVAWRLRNLRTSVLAGSAQQPAAGPSVGQRPTTGAHAPAQAAPPSTALSVLIVDDDADIVKVMSFYVRKALPDAEIRTASDGEKALESVRRAVPDVMLLDLQMPRLNGIEVCMCLRGTHYADRCTIVSVSAAAQQHDVQLLQQLGITRFVPKGKDLGARLAAALHEIRGER